MADFKFTGTIIVRDAVNVADAVEELQNMLDDYEALEDSAKSITIKWDKVERRAES